MPIAVVVDNRFRHLVYWCVVTSEQLKLSAALFDENLEGLDDYPALVCTVVSLTQE